MASQQAFVEFVVDQLQEAGRIASRKMFGEYGLYCDGKFFGMICDSQLFVKSPMQGETASRICRRRRLTQGQNPIFWWKTWTIGSC